MSSKDSVTRWLDQLQTGDASPVRQLWERYFPRLVRLARKKLQDAPRGVADEEDVALSAFGSFCAAAGRGRFPDLLDRDGLWRLLVAFTARKAAHLRRDQGRRKRGGNASAPGSLPGKAKRLHVAEPQLDQVIGGEPSPEFAAQVAEECQRLLGSLGDRDLEKVAVWRMEGYSVEEIAAQLGYAPRSIKRKLHMIRDIWQKEVAHD